MQGGKTMSQNGAKSGMKRVSSRKVEPPSKTSLVQMGFVLAALVLAAVGMREPFILSRIVMFVLAAIVCAAPFVFLALGRKRDAKEAEINADNAAKRQEQTRRELRRMMKSQVEALRMRVAANDDPEARRAAVAQFAAEELLPNVSHGVIASERPLWLQEIYGYAETLLARTPTTVAAPTASEHSTLELTTVAAPSPAQVLMDACMAQIATAGWEAHVDGDGVAVQSGEARAYFQCLHAETPIDEAAVNAFMARLKAGQMRRGAIVANQAFLPEALQAARAHGVGLIRPAHVPTFLDWVARAQTPEPKRA